MICVGCFQINKPSVVLDTDGKANTLAMEAFPLFVLWFVVC